MNDDHAKLSCFHSAAAADREYVYMYLHVVRVKTNELLQKFGVVAGNVGVVIRICEEITVLEQVVAADADEDE